MWIKFAKSNRNLYFAEDFCRSTCNEKRGGEGKGEKRRGEGKEEGRWGKSGEKGNKD